MLADTEPPDTNDLGSVEQIAEEFNDILYKCFKESVKETRKNNTVEQVNPLQPRWKRILQCDDDALLWKAIDWKGQFNAAVTKLQPTESEFQQHLERLLDPVGEVMPTDLSDYRISVPVLDNEIEANEIKYVIAKQVKTNKGCGPDGISPCVFKLLPDSWISFLCIFLNVIFVASCPLLWTSARSRTTRN